MIATVLLALLPHSSSHPLPPTLFPPPSSSPITPPGAVKGLVDVVRGAQKEKVVRVGLLALKNLLDDEQLVRGKGGEGV